jgi:hypothetical protein
MGELADLPPLMDGNGEAGGEVGVEEETLVPAPEFTGVPGDPRGRAYSSYKDCEDDHDTAFAVAATQEMFKRGEISEQELVHLLRSHSQIQALNEEHLNPALFSGSCGEALPRV